MRRLGYILTLIALLGLAAGCGDKPASSPEDGAVQGAGGGGNGSEEVRHTPESSNQTIKVYFTDDDVMDLQEKTREIEVSAEHSKYEGAFKALQTADSGLASLWQNVVLNSVSFSEANGQLAIDISLPDEARLGAGGESLAIEALKKTMFQFDEVKQIELTLDGEQVESLMGHVDLEHPMSR